MVDSHFIPSFTSLVGLTTMGLSLALHNRVVMGLVEMIVIDTRTRDGEDRDNGKGDDDTCKNKIMDPTRQGFTGSYKDGASSA